MADAFMAEHPNVTINITVMENEAFKAALQTNLQAGDVPDLFQSWGGGGLREQVEAGLVQDITDDVAGFIGDLSEGAVGLYQVDGKQYGVPFNAGMVGFWYNKALFEQAGIDAPPATWDELIEDVQTLKDAGHHADRRRRRRQVAGPLLVLLPDGPPRRSRSDGADRRDQRLQRPGRHRRRARRCSELVALEPFQAGFLGAPWDAPDGESGTMASQGAAMDLMGQWAPGAFATQAGVESAADLPWELGWFPFPAVDGGAGAPTDAFGGADGFAVGKDAPPEAVEFLEFITNEANQETWAANSGLPVNTAAMDSVSDPNMQAVLEGLEQRDVRPAVPRPVLHRRGRRAGQRPDGPAVRRRDHAGGRRRGDHRHAGG